MDRVVVVRALKGLGDFLCVVPALRSLRLALPQARITLLGLPSSQPLVSRFGHYIDELLPFPGFPGIPEQPVDVARLPRFLVDVQAREFDLAIQMHGNGSLMNPFTVMLGAKANAGYRVPGAYRPDPARYLPLDESDHEVRRWLRLLAHLGIPGRGEDLEFPLQQADWDGLAALPEAQALAGTGGYVAVHAGATEPARRWSSENFAAVADFFARDGYKVVLTGAGDEAAIAAEVARRMRYDAINLSGRTNLGVMAALLSKARLLVSNDTGVSHLAAALRVPSVVVFTASDPLRWAPLDRDLHRVVGRGGLLPEHTVSPEPSPDAVLAEAYALFERVIGRDRRWERMAPKVKSKGPLPSSGGAVEIAPGADPATDEEANRVLTVRP